ncbi:rod-binding protein [Natronospora cellulosivora (SeqCode)]
MQINTELMRQTYTQAISDSGIEKLNENLAANKDLANQKAALSSKNIFEAEEQKLKMLANEFTSILLNQMFKSMRNTISDDQLLHGGFSEEIFTDMLDEEMSKVAASQKGFNSLGRSLYQQLRSNL